MSQPHVLVFVQQGQRWIWQFDASTVQEALRDCGKQAADRSNDFCWFAAAVVCVQMRRMVAQNLSQVLVASTTGGIAVSRDVVLPCER
jgi:hypothetical protein